METTQTVKKDGLSFQNKVDQTMEAVGKKDANVSDILYPEPVKFQLGKKIYDIKPLSLSKMKLLAQLAQLTGSDISEEIIDQLGTCVAKILGENDVDYVLENFQMDNLMQFFNLLMKINYKGIPIPKGKGAQSKNGVGGMV